MDLLAHPLRGGEFLVLDTETNGLGGDSCELTEVGAVLVGGGELHDRWSSLVRGNLPLGRGIQRFTGITQAQIDAAPDPVAILPSLALLLQGRVLVAHNAPFDRRVLRQAFERSGAEWPDPPVLCTAALARRLLPLQHERKLARLADALGIEVGVTHRALADAETCARIFCALFPRLCAHAATVGEAVALSAPARRPSGPGRRQRRELAVGARELALPEFSELPSDPGVYIFRDAEGRPLYVGKSVSIRRRARAHFAPGVLRAAWTAHARLVDYRATASELGALVLENRLVKELRPPGNVRLKPKDEHLAYIVCRLDIPFPILEVKPAPAPGHAASVGPLRGGRAVAELVEQLDSLYGLRHCGRRLPRRETPSAYGQMDRCLSPCLGDLDPNLYRRRLEDALRVFLSGSDARSGLLAILDAAVRQAAEGQHYERAAALERRRRRMEHILQSVDGPLAATHARPRLLRAPHPTDPARADGLWLAGGRLLDFGELRQDGAELLARTERVLRRAGRRGELGAHVPPEEIDELRIVTSHLASHPGLPELALEPVPQAEALLAFANGSSTTAAPDPLATVTRSPRSTSRRTKARAIGPKRGDSATLVTRPTTRSP